MSDRRREKQLKRKRKQVEKSAAPAAAPSAASVAGREVVARELGDPQRLVLYLKRLSELLAGIEDLRAVRFPPAKVVPALLALKPDEFASLPEDKRTAAFREKMIPDLVTELLGKQARQAFEQILNRAQNDYDRIALLAGRMFMDMWLKAKATPHQNPSWEAIFGISVLDAFFEGHVLSRLVRDSWVVDEAQVARSFAQAFARPEVAKEFAALGLEKPDAAELAHEYGRLARDTERTYLMGFDSLLHLVRGNADLATAHVRTVLSEGVTPPVREAALAMFEEAFRNDMTTPLADDLSNEIVRRLEAFKSGTDPKKGPAPRGAESRDDEKRVAFTALVSIRALPTDKNLFLRSTYVGSFDVYKNVAPVEEVPFIRRIWAEPKDRWALEEYEKFLIERRHNHRAGRVHRFLAEVRKEAREAEPAPPT